MDRLAPKQSARRLAARQRLLLMQKISAGKFHFEPPFTSFDHLVGQRQQRVEDFEAERLGGCEVNDEIDLGRQLDWHVGGLRS